MREFHDFSSEAVRGREWGKLKGFPGPGNGVVQGHDALVAKAEATGQIEGVWQRAKVRNRFRRENGEAAFEVGQESFEHMIGVLQSAGVSQAEFADEAVLEGAPETFDAAFGLRGVGGDLLDAELFQGTSDVGRKLVTGEFFSDGPVRIVALEQAVAIAIEAEGNAVSGEEGVQTTEVAGGVFGFELESGGGNAASGVVEQPEQGEERAAALEPVMTAGIALQHHAEAGAAGAASTILARTSFLRRRAFGVAKNAAHALAAEGDAFVGDEFLLEMGVVEAGVFAACQFEDTLTKGGGQGPRFGSAAVAMPHPGGGVGLEAALEALHLAFTALQ